MSTSFVDDAGGRSVLVAGMESAVTAVESPLELTVVMPCLNEAETLAVCIDKALAALRENHIAGEVVIADNGSTDGSQEIALAHGARVVPVPLRGYGAALNAGILAARGKYVLMGDADDSYEFAHIPRFLAELRGGADLVMGNRFRGGIGPGAMPPLHRYLGNPVLSVLGRVLFRAPIGDFHCGMRGFSKDAYERLGLRTTGMEFASEMVVKAVAARPEDRRSARPRCKKDGRSRPPHLQDLARRLAAPALPADVLAALAVPVPRPHADDRRPRPDGLAAARRAAARPRQPRRGHAGLCRRRCAAGLPAASSSASPPRSSPSPKACCREDPGFDAGSATSRWRPAWSSASAAALRPRHRGVQRHRLVAHRLRRRCRPSR